MNPMKSMKLRFAEISDAKEILEIYKPYILNTTITFEYDVPTLSSFEKRIEGIKKKYPYFVCESGGEIVGYAYASEFSERAAYDWDTELSVYVKEGVHGKGIGSALYGALIEVGELLGYRNFYGRVVSPNEVSEKLHYKFGFELEGVLKKTGYKLGKWVDVSYFCKHVGNDNFVEPILAIGEADILKINEILLRYEEKLNVGGR